MSGLLVQMLQRLKELWQWHEIRGCPGRFVVSRVGDRVSPEALLAILADGRDLSILTRCERFERGTKDDVFVAVFLDEAPPGGLITFCKKDGSFVHTLNEPSGLDRKLKALGYGHLLWGTDKRSQ